MKNLNAATIQLFGAVLMTGSIDVQPAQGKRERIQSMVIPKGFIFDDVAITHPQIDEIIAELTSKRLSNRDLNKTFHKSWNTIATTSTLELRLHQILHYMTTYGTDFKSDFVYIPNEVLEVPELRDGLPLRVIRGFNSDQMMEAVLSLLSSGIALGDDTMENLMTILGSTEMPQMIGSDLDKVANREMKVKLIERYNVMPNDPVEQLRYLIYKATDSTLIIKNGASIAKIAASGMDISKMPINLVRLSEIFLRFKPLFLAFKQAHKNNRPLINTLRRMAESNHRPMSPAPINEITTGKFSSEQLADILRPATVFQLIRVLQAIRIRQGESDARVYRIRNGKSWATRNGKKVDLFNEHNAVVDELEYRMQHLKGKNILYPGTIEYALPSSEKMYIGNYPAGTRIITGRDNGVLIGMYWKDSWGARDLDLAGMASARIGWNSSYRSGNNDVLFSGDITSAPDGASEFFLLRNIKEPYLFTNNVYSGDKDSARFKFIVGVHDGHDIGRNFMVDPSNVLFEEMMSFNGSRQLTMCTVIPTEMGLEVLLNSSASGNSIVSRMGGVTEISREYNANDAKDIFLREFLINVGANLIDSTDELEDGQEVDIDLSPNAITKDTIISLFELQPRVVAG